MTAQLYTLRPGKDALAPCDTEAAPQPAQEPSRLLIAYAVCMSWFTLIGFLDVLRAIWRAL